MAAEARLLTTTSQQSVSSTSNSLTLLLSALQLLNIDRFTVPLDSGPAASNEGESVQSNFRENQKNPEAKPEDEDQHRLRAELHGNSSIPPTDFAAASDEDRQQL